ncbi:MAG TPA: HIRAN domain-containing protein [Solirubrobacterales bacterium]|nr:HIRAN domain-containing protein [Solirubrobacterales bacterium]
MGLLKRLIGDRAEPGSQDTPGTKDALWLADAERFGDIRVEVVGESHYQPAIRAACNWKPGTDTLFHCTAELVPEPTNPYDRNAIKVTINGACVGHLSREDAVTLGPAVRAAIKRQGSGVCRAVIAGHANGDTDNLGVFLHLDAEVG